MKFFYLNYIVKEKCCEKITIIILIDSFLILYIYIYIYIYIVLNYKIMYEYDTLLLLFFWILLIFFLLTIVLNSCVAS